MCVCGYDFLMLVLFKVGFKNSNLTKSQVWKLYTYKIYSTLLLLPKWIEVWLSFPPSNGEVKNIIFILFGILFDETFPFLKAYLIFLSSLC